MGDPVDLALYTKCVDFAARKHRDQRRKDPEQTPYINHPIGIIISIKHLKNFKTVGNLS